MKFPLQNVCAVNLDSMILDCTRDRLYDPLERVSVIGLTNFLREEGC